MEKIVLVSLAICIFVGSVLFAETKDDRFLSENDFNNWVTYYYLSPEPNELPHALKYFCKSNMYNNKVILPMMSFFVAALKDNDAVLEKTYIEVGHDDTSREKTFFLDILWLINDSKSRKLIENARSEWTSEDVQDKIKQQDKSRPYDVLTMPIISPQALDMLWATFFATGNEKPIQRVISVLPLLKERQASKLMIGAAAKWSLESNARQRKEVLMICKKELKEQQGLTKNLLGEIVKKASQ